MDKLVVLKSIGGSFETGFNLTMSIALDGQPPTIEIIGALPAHPVLSQLYTTWQTAYSNLGYQSRISSRPAIARSPRSDCAQAAKNLKQELDLWLRAPKFAPIRDKLQEQLNPTDQVRFILQVDDPILQQLPWQSWELLDRYRSIEVALASPIYQAVQTTNWAGRAVRILAILGDSTGIDVKADRKFLEQLPNADVTFLVEPQRKDLSDQLWEKGWDILFFSGHSSSDQASKEGYLYINVDEKLPISELKYALRRSVDRGLQLAIFNSCKGLGLALELADLLIPQTIFMREPVPDLIAQKFLKHFLTSFVYEDQTLYQSVRAARERLETEEASFICASWLPMIFQNLAARPVRWNPIAAVPPENLIEFEKLSDRAVTLESQPNRLRQGLVVLLSSLIAAGAVSWIRHLGFLQAIELKAYDHTIKTRSVLDSKRSQSPVLVMTIDEDDARIYRSDKEDLSISTPNLIKLLTKLRQANVKVIGLDLFRNPKNLPANELAALRQMSNVVSICFHPYESDPGKRAPQGLEKTIGFADLSPDPDNTIRRHLIAMDPNPSICPAQHSLSMTVTAQYLGLTPQALQDKLLAMNAVMDGFDRPSAYQQSDDRNSLRDPKVFGNILVNYSNYLPDTMSMGDFMNDRGGRTDLTGKIVLIGIARPGSDAIASKGDDYHPTPLHEKLPGVMIHAEKASHLLRMIQDKEPPIWVWTERSEWLWIWLWALGSGSILLMGSRDLRWQIVKLGGVVMLLYGSVIFILMNQRGWVPFIPNVGAIALTAGLTGALTAIPKRSTPT